MTTAHVLRDFILSVAELAFVLMASAAILAAWRAGRERVRPIDPATLSARDRHPSRALPRRWE